MEEEGSSSPGHPRSELRSSSSCPHAYGHHSPQEGAWLGRGEQVIQVRASSPPHLTTDFPGALHKEPQGGRSRRDAESCSGKPGIPKCTISRVGT